MQFRQFGRLDWKVSALGFGCMRLPSPDPTPFSANVDEAEAIRLIRYAIDQGVNYVDTAYGYHGGNSEIVAGKALRDGFRQKVRLATKSPVWLIQKPDDFDLRLNEQLNKLQTDHIDFYLFHGLGRSRWRDVVLKFELLARAEAAKQDGRIGFIGFSFHDGPDAFKEIVDGYAGWTMCQIQYNYMDIESQAGIEGLKYAAAKGLAVVVMEPLLGGRLANPPPEIRTLFDKSDPRRAPAEWALQWVWNQPEVSTVLSGMSAMSQVQENVRFADSARVNSLSPDELGLIETVRGQFRAMVPIPCTQCGYCLPCPHGVSIPQNLMLYNEGFIYGDPRAPRFQYSRFIPEPARASACTQCRECEEKCPQKIIVSEWMPRVHRVLGEEKDY